MYMPNYLFSLKRKYEHINQLIDEELSRPMPDSLTLFKLKLKRLKLKEKIYNIS